MKTQIFAKTESELLPYLPAYKAVLSATGFMGVEVDKNTGVMLEVIKPFSAEQKLVWLYALDRYRFFSKEGKEWFDNQSEIAEACNVSESCVKKFFRSLREANVIKSKGTRIGGHNSNSYIILKDIELVQADKPSQKVPVSPQVERSEQVDSQVAPTLKKPLKAVENVVEEEEDFDSLMECAADDYSSYQAPVEQVHYRTEPDRDPWDIEDDVKEPAKQTKIIFKTVAQFISTNFKQWTTEQAMDVLEANGVKDADNVLKGRGGCKIVGEWFIYDSKEGYFTSDECPF